MEVVTIVLGHRSIVRTPSWRRIVPGILVHPRRPRMGDPVLWRARPMDDASPAVSPGGCRCGVGDGEQRVRVGGSGRDTPRRRQGGRAVRSGADRRDGGLRLRAPGPGAWAGRAGCSSLNVRQARRGSGRTSRRATSGASRSRPTAPRRCRHTSPGAMRGRPGRGTVPLARQPARDGGSRTP
jgi:hypothetical protein